ncbi:MAG: hypothetical protein F6K42_14535 [Leptolyngbya sp. SIO1D8]|nr:hypothetical protein [Leptolyngbya sp. SIO1D8]
MPIFEPESKPYSDRDLAAAKAYLEAILTENPTDSVNSDFFIFLNKEENPI